ncbi:hypothetical protein F2Q70_00022601 [Brassica cretica]|uniref:Uncharacterized protein n=1 Tax=Brassica cretica TaxID=69181 RepID=A0A8S9GLX2_BRACR|nr:hypothetical protein F2Q70_00022601 [Brassica cretica]
MTSRRSNSRYSDRVRTRTGSANAERIQSGDVSDALTEVLREETRLPRLQPKGPKIPRVKNLLLVLSRVAQRFSHSKDCPVTEDPDSVAHLVRHSNLLDVRFPLCNEALTSQMVSQRERIAVLEVERDRDIHRTSRIAHRDIAANYREVPEYLKDRWASKKKKVSAEIWLQEVTANIDLLTELKDGGLTVDAELARLKGMEGDCEDLVASAPVPDWSISELDLPQVSDDSVDQVGGSSVPDDYDCPITEDLDSVAHFVRHFKPAGCPLPALRNMTERET